MADGTVIIHYSLYLLPTCFFFVFLLHIFFPRRFPFSFSSALLFFTRVRRKPTNGVDGDGEDNNKDSLESNTSENAWRERNTYLGPIDTILQLLEGSPFIPSSMKQLFDTLALLKAFLVHPPKRSSEDDATLKELKYMAMEIKSVASSFNLRQIDSEMITRLEMRLKIALTPMSRWMSAARSIYVEAPKPSRMYYPRAGQLRFIEHLVVNLESLLVKPDPDYSISALKPYILRLRRRLRFLYCHLMEIPESRRDGADLEDLIQSIANLAYEAEHAIDSFLLGGIRVWCCMIWLLDILEELRNQWKLIKIESGDMQSILSCVVDSEPTELKIVPIVNSIEIGDKLRQVFTHSAAIYSFSIRTWSLVSSYNERKKEVFLQLLRNASYAPYAEEDSDKIEYSSDMSEAELKLSIFRLLENSRYFIILEDVGDIVALNDIRNVLPNNGFGNRILLTTPSPKLALQCHYDSQKVISDDTAKLQINNAAAEGDVVGFKAETEGMLDLLIRGQTKLHIISICGMPGQGKTTLARKLFNDLSVSHYFDTCAWCCVSLVYEKRELLLELLSQVGQHSHTVHDKNDVELAALLYKDLKWRRFIIFLDDIWKIDVWKDLERCLPKEENRSRIVFTTRIHELASLARSDTVLQPLSSLSDDESFELLKKKVFQKENCPLELLGVGKEIAKSCRGLPLSIILAAGLLAKMEKKVDRWEHIAKCLSSQILNDAETQGKDVIQLSYKHLPDNLKVCFLYFGAFLEDKEIPVSKLIGLWIAEGFIRHTDSKSLEDMAEDYLMDLIGRSLVAVVEEKSNGGVKSCRVHDLLREFCLIKAREENFLQQINEYDGHFSSSYDHLEHSMDAHSRSSTPMIFYVRRLCIYSRMSHFIMLKPSAPLLRSLLFFTSSDICPSHPYDTSFIFHNFKFLHILHLENINNGESLRQIDVLGRLRYLAVEGSLSFIPSSVGNLRDLETFLVKGSFSTVMKVPDSMWDLTKLRHIHINDGAAFDLEPHRLENSPVLNNLQSFSTPSLAYGDGMERILRRNRGIRKLKCIYLDSWDDAKNCNQFPELGFLCKLQSLKVFYNGKRKYPCQFSFPSNLKKLTLSNFHMPWNEISQLATLGNLEVLKLLGNAFEGETWKMEDEMFPKLKFLKLDTLDIVEWSATNDHFPRLERLLLHKCKQLNVIPLCMGDIPTLQMIEVIWCNHSAAISACKIREEQLEYGNEGLKIHVHPKIFDLESS